jgi:ribosomal protein S18 acetylase RimI-like enzyme
VTGPTVELRPTIDRAWLEREAARDPLAHAFALWDLAQNPDRIRFFSAVDGETTLGYLLVWLGHPTATVVHWVGGGADSGLAGLLPPRPLVAIVSKEVRDVVEAARGPAREHTLRAMVRVAAPSSGRPGRRRNVRRLHREDVPSLTAWARRQHDPVVADYPFLDPDAEPTWGAFEGRDLVGVARAEVRLPRLWVLGGVYVQPEARARGWGRSLVSAALTEGEATGARVALYVREDRTDARRLYESLGFRPGGRRVWLDLGAGLAP